MTPPALRRPERIHQDAKGGRRQVISIRRLRHVVISQRAPVPVWYRSDATLGKPSGYGPAMCSKAPGHRLHVMRQGSFDQSGGGRPRRLKHADSQAPTAFSLRQRQIRMLAGPGPWLARAA